MPTCKLFFMLAQVLTFAVLTSGLYALLALGFTLIFGVARVLNLAHGAFLMAGAYLFYIGFVLLKLPAVLAFALAVILTSFLAISVYKGLVRHVQLSRTLSHSEKQKVTLIVTLVVTLLLEQLALALGGIRGWSVPFLPGGTKLFGVHVPQAYLGAFFASWLLIGALWLWLRRTKTGKALLAAASNLEGALVCGINTERIFSLTWGLSGALAAVAGIFFAAFTDLSPLLWQEPFILTFAIVILGGLGSLEGSLLAAYLLGFLETFVRWWQGADWQGLPSLIILLLILILRPKGLLGRELAA